MRIYTRTGDGGETSLFGGQRVAKDAPRIEACGSVDELNSVLGLAVAESAAGGVRDALLEIQRRLFALGADLATPRAGAHPDVARTGDEDVRWLEERIDGIEAGLAPLRNFILPGGSPLASHLHLARAVCRRAERAVVRLARSEDPGAAAAVFLNRLSDFLFVLARDANRGAGVAEAEWKP